MQTNTESAIGKTLSLVTLDLSIAVVHVRLPAQLRHYALRSMLSRLFARGCLPPLPPRPTRLEMSGRSDLLSRLLRSRSRARTFKACEELHDRRVKRKYDGRAPMSVQKDRTTIPGPSKYSLETDVASLCFAGSRC